MMQFQEAIKNSKKKSGVSCVFAVFGVGSCLYVIFVWCLGVHFPKILKSLKCPINYYVVLPGIWDWDWNLGFGLEMLPNSDEVLDCSDLPY